MLNRQTIFAAGAPKTKVIEIPEWDDSVTIRALNAEQLVSLADLKDNKSGWTRAIVASVIDAESGSLMFTDADLPALNAMSVAGIIRLNKAINELNGLTADAQKEAAKN